MHTQKNSPDEVLEFIAAFVRSLEAGEYLSLTLHRETAIDAPKTETPAFAIDIKCSGKPLKIETAIHEMDLPTLLEEILTFRPDLTAKEISQKAGIAESTLSMLRSGKRGMRNRVAKKLIQILEPGPELAKRLFELSRNNRRHKRSTR